MSRVILVSQNPLPYPHIGSWTTIYKNYFEAEDVNIDTILCEAPDNRFKKVEYCIVPKNFTTKVKRKLSKKPHQAYIDSLIAYLNPKEKYIIQVVDNFGFVKALQLYLLDYPELKKQLFIQFFYHGYPPFFGNFDSRWFFEFIDEMIVLSEASYIEHKNYYTILPCLFSVLHNGIDTSIFKQVTKERKLELKQKHAVENKTVFIWCSQDRPKKGLDLILYAWKLLTAKHKNIELWVIGAKREVSLKHLRFFGKIPNDELPEYYQTSDCYLFPVLNHEGFGMSLIEALHCGNYCIASALGGVSEVLQNGQLGVLIEKPHFVDEWIVAMEIFLEKKNSYAGEKTSLYSKEAWNAGMNQIINKAKTLIS